jgi:hypothetical protein
MTEQDRSTPTEGHASAQNPQNSQNTPSQETAGDDIVSITAQLAEAEAWLERQQKQAKLDKIRALQARVASGETIDFARALSSPEGANTAVVVATERHGYAKLPPPEKPRTYHGKGRLEYDEWVRECEHFHQRASASFRSEVERVEFAESYLTSRLKSYWRAIVDQKRRADPEWEPTWALLKQEMLGQLGPAHIRTQTAFEELRRSKQDHRAPLDLLNYLRPLWIEAGVVKESDQIRWFVSALSKEVHSKVVYERDREAISLREVEDWATRAHRLLEEDKSRSDKRGKPSEDSKKGSKNKPEASDKSKDRTKDSKPPYRFNPHKKPRTKSPAKSPPLKERKDTVAADECLYCKKKGHYVKDCPTRPDAGKGKATSS